MRDERKRARTGWRMRENEVSSSPFGASGAREGEAEERSISFLSCNGYRITILSYNGVSYQSQSSLVKPLTEVAEV